MCYAVVFDLIIWSPAMNIATWLQSLSEKRLYILIEDLLKAMSYKRVECTHGVGEIGKDIVFMEVTVHVLYFC